MLLMEDENCITILLEALIQKCTFMSFPHRTLLTYFSVASLSLALSMSPLSLCTNVCLCVSGLLKAPLPFLAAHLEAVG